MELKNIFRMTKTDRYTQDGRDELAKLQETEDVRYKTGDISQKTGLQKQPDGSWAPPKKGGAGAKKAAESKKIDYQVTEKGGKFYATGHQFSDGSQLHAGPFGSEKELHEFMNGSPYKSTAEQRDQSGAGSLQQGNKTTIRQGPNTKTLNETPAEHIKKNWDYYAEPGRYGQEDMEQLVLSPSGYKETDSYSVMGGGKRVQYEKEGGEKIALFFDKDGELDDYEIEAPGSKDAAPKVRTLTGDCKIKIRPETQDKVYQIGEISQKTGLQKTANGWRPVKKNGAAAGSAEKPAASFPSHSGMDAEQYDKKLRQEGWKQTGEYSRNAAGHNVGYFEKNGKRIQVVENSEGRIAGVDEVKPKTEAKPESKEEPSYEWKTDYKSYLPKKNDELRKMYHKESDPKIKKAIKKALQIQYQPESFGGDSAPRVLTGDTRIRVKK